MSQVVKAEVTQLGPLPGGLPAGLADLGVHGLDPFLRVAEHQRARRVHAVDALRARVHHDPGLPGQLIW